MAHQLEKLIADSFGQAQGERERDGHREEDQRHHQEVLRERRGHPRAEGHLADEEENQHVQPLAEHGQAQPGQDGVEPVPVSRGRHIQLGYDRRQPPVPLARQRGKETGHHVAEDRRRARARPLPAPPRRR